MRGRGRQQSVAILCVVVLLALHAPAAWAQPAAEPALPVLAPQSGMVPVPPQSPYRLWAWVGTGLSAAFLSTAITFSVLNGGKVNDMENYVRDNSCGANCNGQPTLAFDDTARAIESDGKTYAGISNIFLGLTLISMATTGILWGLDYKFNQEQRAAAEKTSRARQKSQRVMVAPWVSERNAGLWGRFTF